MSLFPPAFTVLSRIAPPQISGLAVSLSIPTAMVIGVGVVPIGIGFCGDAGSFAWGIILLGGLDLAGAFLASRLSLPLKK